MPETSDDKDRIAQSDDLNRRLDEAKRRNRSTGEATDQAIDDGMGTGMRSGIEFGAALLISIGIGIALEKWLHSVIPLLIMIGLGFAAGLLNVYRAMKGMGYGQTYKTLPRGNATAPEDKPDET